MPESELPSAIHSPPATRWPGRILVFNSPDSARGAAYFHQEMCDSSSAEGMEGSGDNDEGTPTVGKDIDDTHDHKGSTVREVETGAKHSRRARLTVEGVGKGVPRCRHCLDRAPFNAIARCNHVNKL